MTYPFPVGKVRANALNTALSYGRVIARGRRESTSTAASAETEVLRVDGISLTSGKVYWITAGSLLLDTTVANDVGRVRIRLSTSGAATTSSTQFASSNMTLDNATDGNNVHVGNLYIPSGDETISILVTTVRQSGTGNISIVASSTNPLDLFVVDMGDDPGDTGVDL